MWAKICGITKPEQGEAIARLGAAAVGTICVARSPRYVTPDRVRAICDRLPERVERVGVFANASLEEICQTVETGGLTGVQLHGEESPPFCDRLRDRLHRIRSQSPVRLIKAFRIQSAEDLERTAAYEVDALLLDAYHPEKRGGTGKTVNWNLLRDFSPPRPWILAGGLTPENVGDALQRVAPDGIDLSSGVERAPGDKDLERVALLFQRLADLKTIARSL